MIPFIPSKFCIQKAMSAGISAEKSIKRTTYSPMLLLIVVAVIVGALAVFFVAAPIGTHARHKGNTNQMPNSQQ